MNTGNRNVAFNIEEKLVDMNLSPAQRMQAIDAMRAAEDMVAFLDTLGTAIKRMAGMFSLKPSIRA